jgi:hypothetical protein
MPENRATGVLVIDKAALKIHPTIRAFFRQFHM